MNFKTVPKSRREGIRRPGKYDAIFKALMEGNTLEVTATEAEAQNLRASWRARNVGRDIHVVKDGEHYIAWLDDPGKNGSNG
jgi:hypothetical protein